MIEYRPAPVSHKFFVERNVIKIENAHKSQLNKPYSFTGKDLLVSIGHHAAYVPVAQLDRADAF